MRADPRGMLRPLSRPLCHVSLHDVSPTFRDLLWRALDLCHAQEIQPALLVVPDHHARAPLEDHPAFVDEVRQLAAAGHEIYLHGLTHRANPTPPSLTRLWRQRVVSAGEAEFASLSADEGRARLTQGLQRLRALDLPIDGFVAPAWSFRPWLLPMLAEQNVSYTEDHLHVYRPTTFERRASLVLNFASRSVGRVLSTTAYCRLARPLAHALPTRIALHPGDFSVSVLRHEARSLLTWARRFPIVRGADLLSAA